MEIVIPCFSSFSDALAKGLEGRVARVGEKGRQDRDIERARPSRVRLV